MDFVIFTVSSHPILGLKGRVKQNIFNNDFGVHERKEFIVTEII